MVNNFIKLPPLAIVLVGMLSIGLTERSEFLPALLRHSILLVPQYLLTLIGWAVTAWFIEPRLGTDLAIPLGECNEKKGLIAAISATGFALVITGLLIAIPGAPTWSGLSFFSLVRSNSTFIIYFIFCAHAHASGIFPRIDTSCLSYRRFSDECDYINESLHDYCSDGTTAIQKECQFWNTNRPNTALLSNF